MRASCRDGNAGPKPTPYPVECASERAFFVIVTGLFATAGNGSEMVSEDRSPFLQEGGDAFG